MDREKDKDKDKDKDKEKEKSSIKSQLSETKENVKKLIGSKDKQNSKVSLQMTVIEPENPIHNNGDVKNSSNSPLVLTKRPSDIGDIDIIDKSLPDVVNMSKVDSVVSNGSSHGILSPFETINDDDSDSDDGVVDHPHQQLSSSSSASINILMENNNKMMGNVQVSQV